MSLPQLRKVSRLELAAEQQRLWVDLLTKHFHDRETVEEILQLLQGAVLAYLITGDPEPGRRSLARIATKRPDG